MLLDLTKKIDKLCKYIENIVKYDQFGLYNMLCFLKSSLNEGWEFDTGHSVVITYNIKSYIA